MVEDLGTRLKLMISCSLKPSLLFWILSHSFGEKSVKLQGKIQNRKPGFEATYK